MWQEQQKQQQKQYYQNYIDHRSWELTMHTALYSRDDRNWLYVLRKEGEEDVPVLKVVLMQQFREPKNIQKTKTKRLITRASNSNINDKTTNNKDI